MKIYGSILLLSLLLVINFIMAETVTKKAYPFAQDRKGRPPDADLWEHYTRYKHITVFADERDNKISIFGHCNICQEERATTESRINHLTICQSM